VCSFLKARKPRAPKGPKLPAPFVNGTVLQDLRKKQWKLGDEVGKGGFGLIYLGKCDSYALIPLNLSDSHQNLRGYRIHIYIQWNFNISDTGILNIRDKSK
jgi:hypothetical protein